MEWTVKEDQSSELTQATLDIPSTKSIETLLTNIIKRLRDLLPHLEQSVPHVESVIDVLIITQRVAVLRHQKHALQHDGLLLFLGVPGLVHRSFPT